MGLVGDSSREKTWIIQVFYTDAQWSGTDYSDGSFDYIKSTK